MGFYLNKNPHFGNINLVVCNKKGGKMRNIVPQKKKEEKKTSPKGFGPPQPATEAHQKLILKRKKKIEKKLGGNVEFTGKFEAVSYKRTVAGHTDEIVIDVGEEQWVRITVVQKASGS